MMAKINNKTPRKVVDSEESSSLDNQIVNPKNINTDLKKKQKKEYIFHCLIKLCEERLAQENLTQIKMTDIRGATKTSFQSFEVLFGNDKNFIKEFVKKFPKYADIVVNREEVNIENLDKKFREYLKNNSGKFPTASFIRKSAPFGNRFYSLMMNKFKSLASYKKYYYNKYYDELSDIQDEDLKTPQKLKSLKDAVSNNKRFLITTAVSGCDLNKDFMSCLETMAKARDAEILIMLCSDPAKSNNNDYFKKEITKYNIVISDVALNNNLFISSIKTSAKQINPLTGLSRIGKSKGSFIYASPKFFLEYTSTKNSKDGFPRCIMTTGACTNPDYETDHYMSKRTAKIAENDHRFGAIYVEIENKEIFHFTQVEYKEKSKCLYLRDRSYKANGSESQAQVEAVILGDLHVGTTDPIVEKCWIEIIKELKPKYVILHDALDGHSVNHWIDKSIVDRYFLAKANMNDLEKELKSFADKLNLFSGLCEKLIIVPSNHNDRVTNWLRAAKYAQDPINHYTGVCLAKAMLERKHVLKFAVEEMCNVRCNNIEWLDINDDLFLEGVQVNCHGHKGLNGSKGTLQGMVSAYNTSISGHGHAAGIKFDAWRVGTSTYLQEDYNDGPGTWTHTSGILYKHGAKALINIIEGKWKSDK
jgi:hypothetical protein